MKRIRLVLTAVVGAILFAFLYGCGKPNSQETEARANRVRETTASPVGATGAEEVAGGRSNGPGMFTLLDGPQPVNGFESTNANAQETILSPDGTVYEGEVIEGQPSGQGTMTNPNGTHQQGEWRHGKAYRLRGTWVGPDGTKEVGTWNLDGTKSGGTITWNDGREYKGDWKCVGGATELPDGMGVMTWPDGTVYEGEVIAGQPSGQGTMTNPNGTHQQGEWRHGKAYRLTGTWVGPDGTKEVGTWNLDGTRSGGTITWNDGKEYKGDWKCVGGATELPDGMGVMTWPDGRKYAGRFRDGRMEGTGKMTYPDGKVEEGIWKQDKFAGAAK